MNYTLEDLLKQEPGETKEKKEESLAIKLITITSLLDKLGSTYNEYYLPSIVVRFAIIDYLEEKFEQENPLRKEIENFINSKQKNERTEQYHARIIEYNRILNIKLLAKLIFPQAVLNKHTESYFE